MPANSLTDELLALLTAARPIADRTVPLAKLAPAEKHIFLISLNSRLLI